MNYRFLLHGIILLLGHQMCAQSTTSAGIVRLTELTFSKSPTVKRNVLTIDNAEGNLKVQKSTFDYQLLMGASLSRNAFNLFEMDARNAFLSDELRSRKTGFSSALQKKFRTGISANLSIDYSMASDNFPFDRFSENVGAFIEDHSVTGTFSLTQPLLRGRSKKITTALEKSSFLNLESTRINFQFVNSFELLQTGIAYWQYLTAFKSLKIFEENEARVRRVLKITEQLVQADKKPAGDLAQVQADLANQERQTSSAKQTLFNSKLNLGRTIGLEEAESLQLGDPVDEFPAIQESGYHSNRSVNDFLVMAHKNRNDIEASRKLQDALDLQLSLANNNMKPQLDLTGFVNYGGMNMGNGLDQALSALSREEGRSLGFGFRLDFAFALNNNQARGFYQQNEAALKDQKIANENLKRNIDLNVSIALNNLHNSVVILEKALESFNFYEEVFKNEQVKFQNGLTTLLNLILFQERLTFAQLEYLQAQQQFATAIINLRYETGTLLTKHNKNQIPEIRKYVFYTIPKSN